MITATFPLGKFLNRAPAQYFKGFHSLKFICRVYEDPVHYSEAGTDWFIVDFGQILKHKSVKHQTYSVEQSPSGLRVYEDSYGKNPEHPKPRRGTSGDGRRSERVFSRVSFSPEIY